jgi:hypothetical protein
MNFEIHQKMPQNGRGKNNRAGCPGAESPCVAPAVQARRRARRQGQRLPASDGPGGGPSLVVIRDAAEQPAQLDGSRQLTTLIESRANSGCIFLGDDKHLRSMGIRIGVGK